MDRKPVGEGTSIGRYLVERCLMMGVGGAVYRCRDPLLQRDVAILLAHGEESTGTAERILHSQRIIARLAHPNIVEVYDGGHWEGRRFAVLEYIDAGSLSEYIRDNARVPWATAMRIGSSLAGALHFLHDKGVVNGAVQPFNIALRSTGEPVLLEFGVAETGSSSASEFSIDLWGLCGTLICLLTHTPWPGRAAGVGKPDGGKVDGYVRESRPALLEIITRHSGELPTYIVDVLLRGLNAPGHEPYADAAHLGRALGAAADRTDQEELQADGVLTLPEAGETVILHVEYREEDRPGAYREYELLDHLSDGAFGDVYRAIDQQTKRVIALKILKSRWLDDHGAVERFRREAQIMSNLVHPNVVRVFNFGRYGQTFFIAMEFVEGRTLAEVMAEGPVEDIRQAVGYVRGVLRGLAASAELGIVHRDVKPSNIKVTHAGEVRIFDFGVAYVETEDPLTKTGAFVGTVRYASPEQALGHSATPATDVYAAGVILYELLTGGHPHPASGASGRLAAIASKPAEDVTKLRDGLPTTLAKVVTAMLAKAPLARPSATEAVDALDAVLAGDG